jgi:hypothetical protein
MTLEQVLADFDRRIVLHQQVDDALLVGRGVLRGFQPFRTVGPRDVPPTPWLLRQKLPSIGRSHDPDQHVGHTPGPVRAACAVAGLVTAAGVGWARWSGLRVAAWTFAATGLAVLVIAAMGSAFSWRYQLPQLVLLAPAGALGPSALLHRDLAAATGDPASGREGLLPLLPHCGLAGPPLPSAVRGYRPMGVPAG